MRPATRSAAKRTRNEDEEAELPNHEGEPPSADGDEQRQPDGEQPQANSRKRTCYEISQIVDTMLEEARSTGRSLRMIYDDGKRRAAGVNGDIPPLKSFIRRLQRARKAAKDSFDMSYVEHLTELNYDTLRWTAEDVTFGALPAPKRILQTRIPVQCIEKFVEGEMRRGRTSFRRRQKTKGTLLMKIFFQCVYGPEDHRRPRQTGRGNKRSAGLSIKRGCRCHFIITVCASNPSTAVIRYPEHRHVDAEGSACHGKHCSTISPVVSSRQQRTPGKDPTSTEANAIDGANEAIAQEEHGGIGSSDSVRDAQEGPVAGGNARQGEGSGRDGRAIPEKVKQSGRKGQECDWKKAKEQMQNLLVLTESNPVLYPHLMTILKKGIEQLASIQVQQMDQTSGDPRSSMSQALKKFKPLSNAKKVRKVQADPSNSGAGPGSSMRTVDRLSAKAVRRKVGAAERSSGDVQKAPPAKPQPSKPPQPLAVPQQTDRLNRLQLGPNPYQLGQPKPLGVQPTGMQPLGLQTLSSQLMGSQLVSSQPMCPQPMGLQPMGLQPMGSQPLGLQALNPQLMVSQPPIPQHMVRPAMGLQPMSSQTMCLQHMSAQATEPAAFELQLLQHPFAFEFAEPGHN